MGWFSSAVNAVSGAVTGVANAAGEIISDLVETVGNAISDGLNFIGFGIPGWSHLTRWIGSVISSITDFVSVVVKVIFNVVGGIIAGAISIGWGIVGIKGKLIKSGFGDIWNSVFGGIVLIILTGLGITQQLIPFIQTKERRLTEDEINDMKRIFGDSLSYYNVRIVEGKRAGIYSFSDRPVAIGNTIYMKNHNPTNKRERLAHEMVHVWQYQNKGIRYISDAINAQVLVNNAYNWEKEIERGIDKWTDFNLEAQGELILDVYLSGILTNPIGVKGEFFDSTDNNLGIFNYGTPSVSYTGLANEAWDTLRNDRSQRIST